MTATREVCSNVQSIRRTPFYCTLILFLGVSICRIRYSKCHFFNRVTLCVSAAIAVVAWLSVTCRYWIETDKDIIKLFSRPCSPTTMVFYYHIRLRNCNGRGSLSLGWTSFSVWKHSMCSRVARLLLNRHRIPMKVVQLIRNWGLRFQIRNYFTSITYGSRGIAHAHCQFCDLRLKSPSISETVRYRPMVPMER